jgi:putative ABC transport system substrate-binding protein
MNRRAFVSTVLGSVLATPLATMAQQAGKVYRVGIVANIVPTSQLPVDPNFRAFVQTLGALGYVEGQNLIVERRSAEGHFERFSEIFGELVRLRVDVIVTSADPMTRAAKAVTTTVPIVMVLSGQPEAEGFIQSLARPGGNITGLKLFVGPEYAIKRLQLLIETLPGVSRVAWFGSKEDKEWENPFSEATRGAARVLNVTLIPVEYTRGQYADAFMQIGRAKAEALYVTANTAAYNDRVLIVDFATRARLPSMFAYREVVELGGLMSYGANLADLFRRAAGYVDKILKGANPADLPVEQPTKFDFIINLKTAKALGLTIPQSLLLRADEVIE